MSKYQKIILIALIALGLFGLFFYPRQAVPVKSIQKNELKPEVTPAAKTAEKITGVQTTLEINSIIYETAITEKTSVYAFMNLLRNEGKINFTEKTYIGIGKFIDSIGGISGNNSESWIYYVNGQKAEIGVSNYQINPGDVVSWKYEKNY